MLANVVKTISNTAMAPNIILGGNTFTPSQVTEIVFDNFSYFVMGDRVTLQAPAGSGGAVYTAGASISISSANVISCTLVPPVYTGGAFINIEPRMSSHVLLSL